MVATGHTGAELATVFSTHACNLQWKCLEDCCSACSGTAGCCLHTELVNGWLCFPMASDMHEGHT